MSTDILRDDGITQPVARVAPRPPPWRRGWFQVTGAVVLTAAVSLGAIAASGYGHRAPAPRLAAAAAPAKAHEAAPAPTPEKSTTSPSRLAPQPTKTIVVTQPPPQVIIQNPPAQAPAAPHPASALRYVGSGIYAWQDRTAEPTTFIQPSGHLDGQRRARTLSLPAPARPSR